MDNGNRTPHSSQKSRLPKCIFAWEVINHLHEADFPQCSCVQDKAHFTSQSRVHPENVRKIHPCQKHHLLLSILRMNEQKFQYLCMSRNDLVQLQWNLAIARNLQKLCNSAGAVPSVQPCTTSRVPQTFTESPGPQLWQTSFSYS